MAMMSQKRRRILLVQLPIPAVSGQLVRGNIPLAAGYLAVYARRCGLEEHFAIEILPAQLANTLGDVALVDAILARQPWMVGFTCYLWNVERSLWVAQQLKAQAPQTRIVVGGPEITLDNFWVLEHPAVDYAVVGEGEATLAQLLSALANRDELCEPIPGLVNLRGPRATSSAFIPRAPLPSLDLIASPYLEGILDPSEERTLLLETLRGCVFKCKFCYYPKNYDRLYFLSMDKVREILHKAREAGVRELVLLDPTLNQRRDLVELLRLLAEINSDRQWSCFGELRAEGINDELAQLLAQANFTEVEVGLQSTEPQAMRLMDRNNNLRAFERGITAMRRAGIRVKVDLIIGLPGDTPDSIRRSIDYLYRSGLYDDVQVFHLMVLPGTDFRRDAARLGLRYQPSPPYYVTRTPDLHLAEMFTLMQEASDTFDLQWDNLPELQFPSDLITARQHASSIVVPDRQPLDWTIVNLPQAGPLQAPTRITQSFTLWLRSDDFRRDAPLACQWIERLLQTNPFLTLTLVLEALRGSVSLPMNILSRIWSTCLEVPSYLDRYFAVQPGHVAGAKRLVVAYPEPLAQLDERWQRQVEEFAELYCCGSEKTLREHNYV